MFGYFGFIPDFVANANFFTTFLSFTSLVLSMSRFIVTGDMGRSVVRGSPMRGDTAFGAPRPFVLAILNY